ncbi:hypothetical protein HK101_003496, partial [Irineochytrium annulatum]
MKTLPHTGPDAGTGPQQRFAKCRRTAVPPPKPMGSDNLRPVMNEDISTSSGIRKRPVKRRPTGPLSVGPGGDPISPPAGRMICPTEEARRRVAFLQLPGVVSATPTSFVCHCGKTLQLLKAHAYNRYCYWIHMRSCGGAFGGKASRRPVTVEGRREALLAVPGVVAVTSPYSVLCHCGKEIKLKKHGGAKEMQYCDIAYWGHRAYCLGAREWKEDVIATPGLTENCGGDEAVGVNKLQVAADDDGVSSQSHATPPAGEGCYDSDEDPESPVISGFDDGEPPPMSFNAAGAELKDALGQDEVADIQERRIDNGARGLEVDADSSTPNPSETFRGGSVTVGSTPSSRSLGRGVDADANGAPGHSLALDDVKAECEFSAAEDDAWSVGLEGVATVGKEKGEKTFGERYEEFGLLALPA